MSVSENGAIAMYCENKSSELSKRAMSIYHDTVNSSFNENLMIDLVGARFLGMMSKLLKPKRILEIGTFSGFTAQVLAEGLRPDGKLYSIEIEKDHYLFSKENLKSSHCYNKIELILGDAIEAVPEIDDSFDLVFIDAAKRQYTKHYEAALNKLNEGGLIIADNALWKNRVLIDKPDNMTIGVKRFNDFVSADERVNNVLIPVGDGMHLITKI